MSKQQGDAEPEVHRLVDIVVEEVSLVDRAANQHRFLVVKRSDMSQAKENEEGTDGAAEGSVTTKADATGMRSAAVRALETLTQAVEQLGESGELDAEALNGVAAELREVVEQLAEAAGVDAEKAGAKKPKGGEESGEDQEDDDKKDDEGGEDEDSDADAASRRRKADDLLKSVRDLIGQMKGQLTPAPGAPIPSAAPGATVSVAQDAVSKALASVADALKDQGQRLAKLEKKHGLPNSTPRSERSPTPRGGHAVRWPLDMNRPMDRESVDKTVSFHDTANEGAS